MQGVAVSGGFYLPRPIPLVMHPSIPREEWQQVAERYRAGETTTVIAASYETAPENVRLVLVRLDVPRRHRGVPGEPIGTRRQRSRGYVYVKTETGWVQEHRAVAAAASGRSLRPDEHVHHDDGVRSNNELKNLETLTRAEHGRRHHAPSAETIAEIQRRYAAGDPVREIHAASGVSLASLYRYVRDLPRRNAAPAARRSRV